MSLRKLTYAFIKYITLILLSKMRHIYEDEVYLLDAFLEFEVSLFKERLFMSDNINYCIFIWKEETRCVLLQGDI